MKENMTFSELHAEAVTECGQSTLMLSQVMLNDKLEREGREEFQQDKFSTCMDRGITLYMPYYDHKNETHRKFANLYGLIIANHRQEKHEEDKDDEIAEYLQVVHSGFIEDSAERVEMASRDWWAS